MQPVLIVEPDPLLHTMLQVTLTAAGYQTMVTTDGLTGLLQARQIQPALMVLDLHLPDVVGVTIVRVLRNIPMTRHIPVIAMSLDSDHPHELRQIPNVDVLAKPFAQDELLRLVAAYTRPTGIHPRRRYAAHTSSFDDTSFDAAGRLES
jgi:DNA-binding response OmpR family regulator